jgi:hypothetical protein
MKTLAARRYAFTIAIAVVTLTGCGAVGTAPQLDAVRAAGIEPVTPDSELRGETLTSTKVRSYCSKDGGHDFATFKATGTASGPLPGTFKAHGKVKPEGGRTNMHFPFHEVFEIVSNSKKIGGVIRNRNIDVECAGSQSLWVFALSKLHYRLKHSKAHGTVSATLEGGYSGKTEMFTESFQ